METFDDSMIFDEGYWAEIDRQWAADKSNGGDHVHSWTDCRHPRCTAQPPRDEYWMWD